MERIGYFMHTAAGKFWPLDPRPEDLAIETIAHQLANTCRFNGATPRVYSVAEHSVLVAMKCPPWCRLEALLHDASEFAVGDVIRPIKHADKWVEENPQFHDHPIMTNVRMMNDCFREIEDRVEKAVAERFKLQWPWPEPVKRADQAVGWFEVEEFFPDRVSEQFEKNRPDMVRPFIQCLPPQGAKLRFMATFKGLMQTREADLLTREIAA